MAFLKNLPLSVKLSRICSIIIIAGAFAGTLIWLYTAYSYPMAQAPWSPGNFYFNIAVFTFLAVLVLGITDIVLLIWELFTACKTKAWDKLTLTLGLAALLSIIAGIFICAHHMIGPPGV